MLGTLLYQILKVIIGWIELLFLVVKILFYATLYSILVGATLQIDQKIIKSDWLHERLKYKWRFFFLSTVLFSTYFFNYSFSYWQYTGFEENPSLPIGFDQRIYSPDYEWVEFYPDLKKTEQNEDVLLITNFAVDSNFLCANISQENRKSRKFKYIICNMATRKNIKFKTVKEFDNFALAKDLPQSKEFKDFIYHYKKYFNNKTIAQKWFLP